MKQIILYVSVVMISICGCGFSATQKTHAGETDQAQSGENRTKILISTTLGDMVIELYNETPLHRDNFIQLAETGYYDNVLFHRVISGFMIQGGDPDSRNAQPGAPLGVGGPGYNIPAEFVQGLYHEKGALSAARMGDNVNPEKESSGSQFYIVQGRVLTSQELDMIEQRTGTVLTAEQRRIYSTTGGTPHLDGAYTVFGRLVQGFEILDRIAAVETDRANRPIQDVRMTMSVLKD
jgi:cyclophilin family peptidyl-prolyl cis-trans isomerase